MAWCAAVACNNYKKKNKDLTFFVLPKTKAIADASWKVKIKRENLPKVIYICEEHFEDSCFDKSVDFRNQLLTSKEIFVTVTFVLFTKNHYYIRYYIYIYIYL